MSTGMPPLHGLLGLLTERNSKKNAQMLMLYVLLTKTMLRVLTCWKASTCEQYCWQSLCKFGWDSCKLEVGNTWSFEEAQAAWWCRKKMEDYNFSCQFTADLIAMNTAGTAMSYHKLKFCKLINGYGAQTWQASKQISLIALLGSWQYAKQDKD